MEGFHGSVILGFGPLTTLQVVPLARSEISISRAAASESDRLPYRLSICVICIIMLLDHRCHLSNVHVQNWLGLSPSRYQTFVNQPWLSSHYAICFCRGMSVRSLGQMCFNDKVQILTWVKHCFRDNYGVHIMVSPCALIMFHPEDQPLRVALLPSHCERMLQLAR